MRLFLLLLAAVPCVLEAPPLALRRSSVSLSADGACPVVALSAPLSPLPANVQAALDAVQTQLGALVSSPGLPGVAAVVSYRGDALLSFAAGQADVAKAVAMVAQTPSRIASVTKLFTAVLAFLLVDAGLLPSLDATLVSLEPRFSCLDPFGHQNCADVTVRHLLSHTAGLQREAPPAKETGEALEALAKLSLKLPPGSRPSYSNLGFALLGNVLGERDTGATHDFETPFEASVMQRIVTPLGLHATGFDCAQRADLAVGYTADGTPVPPVDLGWIAPAGQLFSSASDLSVLLQEILAAADGQPSKMALRPATARALLSPLFLEPDGLSLFGMPWEMRRHSNYNVLMKGGNLEGYTALVWAVPSMRLSVSVVLNGGSDEFVIGDLLSEALLPAFQAALLPLQPTAQAGPAPDDFVGLFVCPGFDNIEVLVDPQDKALLLLSFLIPGGGAQTVYLSYFQGDTHRISIPQGLLPCLSSALNAISDEYVQFARSGGRVSAVSIPGYLGQLECTRQ